MSTTTLPSPRATSPELAPGTRLGGFVVREELARGGMGLVYRASQPALARDVALKLLPASSLEDDDLAARFLREARAAAGLSHENLVRIYDAGVHAHGAWFAMELVEGRSLSRAIDDAGGRLDPEQALGVAIDVACALAALASAGVVHRDVKPENVLLPAGGGPAKLADLGLARTLRGSDLTLDGDFLGTPGYVAPEQALDPRLADVRSDLWGLGATLFHALFGRAPFEGASKVVVLQQAMTRDVRLPRAAATLPSAVRTTLRGLLARDPGARFATAADARLALERSLAAVRARKRPRRRAPRAASIVTRVLVLGAALLGLTTGAAAVACPDTRAALRRAHRALP